MAEEFLVTRELTREMIACGAQVLACLDKDGFPVQAAYWRFDYDDRAWLLFIVSPGIGKRHMHEGYFKMVDVMRRLSLDELDYRIVDDYDTRYRALHREITFFDKRPPTAPRTWLPSGIKMGEDLHVYRI